MLFPSAPISYAIELTFACKNACPGCSNVWHSHKNQTLQNWKALFDRICPPENRSEYVELIRITGGEPTLHPNFYEIISYIDSFGIPHALFTCGRWQTPDDIIRLYRNCKNFIGMLISLHGGTVSAHHAFVQNQHLEDSPAFEETCDNISQASQAGIDVFTNTVLTRHSCDQIRDIISLSQRLGATCAVFNRFLGSPTPIEPSENQLRKAILFIEELQNEGVPCRIGNCVPPCFVKNSSEGANGGIEHCAISPQGWVRPNNQTDYVFGNIFEQSIQDIWASEKAQWYRAQIPQACSECALLSRCRGGEKRVIGKNSYVEKDRLMTEPVVKAEPETLTLDPDFKPVPNFRIRQEPFGYLLTRYNWSLPISPQAKPIIDAIDGGHTLAQIQEKFGDDALNFLGLLFQEHFIGFDSL